MAEFGWAYVSGALGRGGTHAVQTSDSASNLSGSQRFVYDGSSVVLTGSLLVKGDMDLSGTLNIDTLNVNETIILSQTGSTQIGNTTNDTHIFTGQIRVTSSNNSDIIYKQGSTEYSATASVATDSPIPDAATFNRAVDPALTVSGTAVFEAPVALKGGLFGASPIKIFAPLRSIGSSGETFDIKGGQFKGNLRVTGAVTITGSGPADGMEIQMGALKMNSVEPGSFLPIITMENRNASNVQRPQIILSNNLAGTFSAGTSSMQINAGEISFKVPTNDAVAGEEVGSFEFKRKDNATNKQSFFRFAIKSVAPLSASNGAVSGSDKVQEIAVLGDFQGTVYKNNFNQQRGLVIFGNVVPKSIAANNANATAIPTDNFSLGTPNLRWGDVFIGDDREINFGDSQDVKLGFNSTTDDLEVSGKYLSAKNNLRVQAGGYVSFGDTDTTSGYGFRDNSGTLQFKNSGGDWTNFGAGGSGGTIGAAEDGNYNDGLFIDFTTETPIGTPIDRFNELFSVLVPNAAPDVSQLDYNVPAGHAMKISFDTTNDPTGYTQQANTAGFTELDVNDQVTIASSGANLRLGVYQKNQEITGTVNYNVAQDMEGSYENHPADAFGNAETGSLQLFVNGASVHSINLAVDLGTGSAGSGTGLALNANGSGFINLSVADPATDANNKTFTIFKHRTSKVVIDTRDQRNGWNYAQVKHVIGASTKTTNFLEWINDGEASGSAITFTNPRISSLGLSGNKYLSGVRYHTSAAPVYNTQISNFYRNTYPTGSVITFSSNFGSSNAQTPPAIGGSEDYTKQILLTASFTNTATTYYGTSFTNQIAVSHPFKTQTGVGPATGSGILLDNITNNTTNLSERFTSEAFRLPSGSFANQSAVTSATWFSGSHMTGSDHANGLLVFAQKIQSPKNTSGTGITNGNFTGPGNAYGGQPNYSSVSGTRTYFRKVQNTSGATKRDLKITTTKSSRINNDSLTTNNVQMFVKLPGATGFMDVSQNFSFGTYSNGAGALINGADDNSNTGGTVNSNAVHCVTFGTQSIANNEYIVVKMIADAGWTGNFSQINFQFGASDVSAPTEAPALDDIDGNDVGSTVKLSFGATNGVVGYSNATRSSIGASNLDSNATFSISGDQRGAFQSVRVIDGNLNEDVGANGNNYLANSFKDAYTGSLVIEVNGSELHTVNLNSSVGTINSTNGNGSGFALNALSFSETTDGIPDYTKNYRTGTYTVGNNDQRNGWNYARVIHRIGGSNTTTNYVDWVNDPSGSTVAMASSSAVMDNFDHGNKYYQSGVGYFASRPSASFKYIASQVYSNVYSNSSTAVSYGTTTNSSVTKIKIIGTGINDAETSAAAVALPSLNNSAGCEAKDIQITGTVLFDNLTSIKEGLSLFTAYDIAVASTVVHPLKTNLTTTTYSKTAFMVYSGSLGSTNLNTNEYFNNEAYRIVSGNYVSQSHVTSGGNAWNSTISVNDNDNYATYCDGMVTVNGYAISPLKIGNAGDTRNVANGGILQAPANNPNYSSLTKATRTFYRYFRNQTGVSSATPTLQLYGDATIVAKSGAFYTGTLGANKLINVEIKVPFDPSFTGGDDTSTAWSDAVKPYSAGVQPNTDGVGVYGGGGSGLDQTVDANGNSFQLQLQQKQIRNNQYVIVKITAHKDWTGYLSRINISY
tara:strand:+ start:8165 stop:13150 length:4986 start_codon:yes stop_codon:yes gene_type:complete